ncbi:methyl-accepting chemotaxis protein [Marinobacter sp. ANT_B65]|uniref:methyl-accepting chemotaxis protein n=1 Tax=Marinobacter sp. ANT_B65 TaxID=2039467 RepID=UPI000BBF1A21|nr:methyl-accepting chemotaxis protein [Marinobacter sp. ANT_B65]PCM46221.1 methyl-accepting chemotaxis protein [Marinobacter sp. ANT_B65]
MNQFISPAVALMNRLPMLYKFSLISILFLLPIGGLSWLVMTELNRSVEAVTRGVSGLEQLRRIDHLVDVSMDYRDYRAPAVTKNNEAIRARSDKAAEEITSVLERLILEARSFDASGAWAEQVEALQADWQTLRADDHYQGNFDPQFKYYQEFVQKALALLPATIETSGLGQGTSRENQVVLGLIRETLPDARSVIGQARSYGSYALVEGQLGYALSETLNEIYDGLTNRSSLLLPALALAADVSPALASRAGDALPNVEESLLGVRELLDVNIITPMRLELSWQEYDSRLSAQLESYSELKTAVFDVIETSLNARLGQEVSQRRLIMVSLVAVLLIVVYLYIGFFMSVRTAINRFSEAARKVAAGDMTTRISLDNRDELGELTVEFNSMTDRIAELIRSVGQTTSEVDQQAAKVKDTAAANSEAVARQMAESGQINEAMNQMVEAVNEVTESARRVADSATAAEQDTETGRDVVSDTVETINRLASEISGAVDVISRVSADSDSISQVLVEIKAIAAQTNLLALNAAIEAARAGEYGRGFAVVADEVRSLSQRTHKSTEEIEGMISQLQSGVKDAVTAMTNSRDVTQVTVEKSGEVTEALSRIAQGISVIVDMSHQIAQAAEEQSAVSKDVNASVAHIGELGASTASNAEETLISSQEMSDLTASLQRLVEAFKV